MFFSNLCNPWQETFADAGDGDGGGGDPFRTILRQKTCFRNSTFQVFRAKKVFQTNIVNMFIYTENDIESYRNTQNINIYPKAHQKHENT